MKRLLVITSLLLASFSMQVFAQTVPVRMVSYNLLNFPHGRNDCGSGNVNLPNRVDTLRKIMQYLKPDILAGCEIQDAAACDSILTRSLNVFGTTHYQRANFVTSSSSGDLHNMLFYNSAKLVLKEQRVINGYPRRITHYILYLKDNTLPLHHDTCFVEVFIAHLKAGSATTDQNDRAEQTADLRQVLNARPPGRHLFVCGDLNTYRSSEACYQNLVSGGTNYLRDPLNAPGNWTSNSSFGYLHTQSPRVSGSTDCGVTGGLDDRFDHILVSQNVMNGNQGLQYVANSYKAIGNDGNHYNQSILSGGNSQYPDSVVRALYYNSDHLPVKIDLLYTIPVNYGLNLTLNLEDTDCTSGLKNITVSPNLGQAPYTFQWSANAGGGTNAVASNLPGGVYCVTVTDFNGVTDEVCIELAETTPFNVYAFDGMDDGSCTASPFVVAGGGIAPYTYQWNDPQSQTSSAAFDLCAGNYTCIVTDQRGCSISQPVVVYSEVVGLSEVFLNEQVEVYPNPVTDKLTIASLNSSLIKNVHVDIYTLSGALVYNGELIFDSNQQAEITLTELEKGIYLIELEYNGVMRRERMVKL